nr:cyclic nucleotide-gated cation channel alpha-3-like [Lytechinus pictus]
MMSEEPAPTMVSQGRVVLSPIAAARKKKKMNRKNNMTSGQPVLVDSFLKRFTTRRQPDVSNHTTKCGSTVMSVVIEERDESDGDEYGMKTIFVPDGDFLLYWLTVVSIAVVYNLWVLIAREAWPELQDKSPVGWFIADYFCDFIYILDIVVQARTAYLEEGLLVTDVKILLCHYVKSKTFIVDIISLLPTDLFYLINTETLHTIIRFPRFLRAYRFYTWYTKVETRTYLPNTFRVLYLTHILLLGLHWTAAAYYLICEESVHQLAPDITYGPDGDNATLALKYLVSFYWSTMTLTTIGELPSPHTEVEYVIQIIGYLIGIFIFATVVGQVGNIIGNRNLTRMEFEREVDHAKGYMRRNNVPRDVQLRILRWYDYTWERGATRGQCDVNSLGLLPETHRTELALHVNLQTLKKVSILKFCPPEFLHDLVLKMHLCIFTPDDIVFKKGAVAKEMFIVSHGFFKITDEAGHVISTLKSGDYFGEDGILDLEGNSHRRIADVYSVGFSELFSLSREDVLGVMKDYPTVKSMFEEEALIKLGKLQPKDSDCTGVNGTDNERYRTRTESHAQTRGANIYPEAGKDSAQNDSLQPDETRRILKTIKYIKAKNRNSSARYSTLSDIVIDEMQPDDQGVILEKIDSSAGEVTRKKETVVDTHVQMISVLRRENESKASYIQALEKRNQELEALLKATSSFQTSDA